MVWEVKSMNKDKNRHRRLNTAFNFLIKRFVFTIYYMDNS